MTKDHSFKQNLHIVHILLHILISTIVVIIRIMNILLLVTLPSKKDMKVNARQTSPRNLNDENLIGDCRNMVTTITTGKGTSMDTKRNVMNNNNNNNNIYEGVDDDVGIEDPPCDPDAVDHNFYGTYMG